MLCNSFVSTNHKLKKSAFHISFFTYHHFGASFLMRNSLCQRFDSSLVQRPLYCLPCDVTSWRLRNEFEMRGEIFVTFSCTHFKICLNIWLPVKVICKEAFYHLWLKCTTLPISNFVAVRDDKKVCTIVWNPWQQIQQFWAHAHMCLRHSKVPNLPDPKRTRAHYIAGQGSNPDDTNIPHMTVVSKHANRPTNFQYLNFQRVKFGYILGYESLGLQCISSLH